jgi:hypothetical protein
MQIIPAVPWVKDKMVNGFTLLVSDDQKGNETIIAKRQTAIKIPVTHKECSWNTCSKNWG